MKLDFDFQSYASDDLSTALQISQTGNHLAFRKAMAEVTDKEL